MGLLFYPGKTLLGTDVFCRVVDGEIVPCEDQKTAKREWDEAAYWREQGRELTGEDVEKALARLLKK